MNKFHILILILFGFLLTPGDVFACEMNSANHSSRKEISSKMCNDDCCKKDSHSKSKNNDGCGGKCNHSKCGCASSCNSSVSIAEWNSTINRFNFSSGKQGFCNYETNISSGFNSLWLIPKIC
ncbi:hypothetical protein [Flavobacterium taihuense]|uniref:Uncharacterized protein n=1 Tax=Flavobacterium taihuense TaxID=2857508 RepID=A0ABS6XZQ8_9FLAO|nr:hypothetical protein [Flavobacterium taihuense]MBW4362145.1 hypothetical protein [Flavobacterium taihuense]